MSNTLALMSLARRTMEMRYLKDYLKFHNFKNLTKKKLLKKHYSHVSVVVEPPSPEITGGESRLQRNTEIRRHSSHSPSLTVKEYEKELDRRHSGVAPNLLGLDSDHMRYLSSSPAATRRISCGSLFKVCFLKDFNVKTIITFCFSKKDTRSSPHR